MRTNCQRLLTLLCLEARGLLPRNKQRTNVGGFPLCVVRQQLCFFGRYPAAPKPALLGSYKRNLPPLHLHYRCQQAKKLKWINSTTYSDKWRYILHPYLVLKERVVYLAKCFHGTMLLFVGFDEPGSENQEVNCNPLYPDSLEIRCPSQSAYTE
jgi:hypothetical protein